ncbi:MAG TPA: tetratricopeptide repeat protein, partial [Flavobacteriales bacterium]|nr:tetratricopeptide repeat protein [Flavobacteriales bacterium]
EALKQAEKEANRLVTADAQICLARYYLLKEGYEKTKKLIDKSISQLKLLVDGKNEKQIKSRLASVYNLYSILHYRLGQNQKSYDYQNEAVRLFREIDDIHGMTHIMHNLANSYITDNRLSQAKAMLEEIGNYKDRISLQSLYFYYQNYGLYYMKSGNHKEAHDSFTEALSIAQSQKMVDSEITVLTLLGKLAVATKMYKQAYGVLKEAEEKALEANLEYELKEVYTQQVEMNKGMGKFNEMQEIEAKLLALTQNNEAKIRVEYEKKRKEDSLKIAKSKELMVLREKELLEAHRRRQMMFIYIPVIGGIVIGAVIFFVLRARNKR